MTSCRSVHRNKSSSVVIEEKHNECKKTPPPENLALKDSPRGEVQVPFNVSLFFKYLLAGSNFRRWKQTIHNLISQDTVNVVTSGLKKTQKHLAVGLALNSLAGSRKVVEMMCGSLCQLPYN